MNSYLILVSALLVVAHGEYSSLLGSSCGLPSCGSTILGNSLLGSGCGRTCACSSSPLGTSCTCGSPSCACGLGGSTYGNSLLGRSSSPLVASYTYPGPLSGTCTTCGNPLGSCGCGSSLLGRSTPLLGNTLGASSLLPRIAKPWVGLKPLSCQRHLDGLINLSQPCSCGLSNPLRSVLPPVTSCLDRVRNLVTPSLCSPLSRYPLSSYPSL